jgi:hypothetical protein
MGAPDLLLAVEADVLRVTVVNPGAEDLRLWSRDSSWGWSMFSLLVEPNGSGPGRELTAGPVRWTRNVPRALTVTAGGRLDYELGHADPTWEGAGTDDGWLGQPLRVRARLRITQTPEAVDQDVFIGEALSDPVLSMPPHGWLAVGAGP